MNKGLLLAALAVVSVLYFNLSCGDDDDDGGGNSCNQDAVPYCLSDCNEEYIEPEDVVLKDACVYDCYQKNGCDAGCLTTCIHNNCAFMDDLGDYGICQQNCLGNCSD